MSASRSPARRLLSDAVDAVAEATVAPSFSRVGIALRAQLLLADAWARRFSAAGVASCSMHPGWVDTPG
jgi:hypothetical protein